MKKDTLINLRVSKGLKESFQSIVEENGFTMSEVLEASMLDIVKRGIIPINIRAKAQKKKPEILTIPFIKQCLEEVLSQMNQPSIKNVSLFGSYAKGSANASSDVDLFVDAEEGFSLLHLAELRIKLEKALGKKVDLATDSSDPYFMKAIRRERIQLYEAAD